MQILTALWHASHSDLCKSLFRPTCQNIDLNQSEERRKNTIWRACCDHRTSGQWGILTVVLVCRFHCIHLNRAGDMEGCVRRTTLVVWPLDFCGETAVRFSVTLHLHAQ